MTTIHEQLRDAVADVRADVDSLAIGARREGLRRRRVRRSLTAAGSLAATVAIAAGAWALLPGDAAGRTTASDPATYADSSPSASSDPTAGPDTRPGRPSTGRSTAAILLDLVGEQIDTTIVGDSIRGSGDDSPGDLMAEFRIARPDAYVAVNVQALADIGDAGRCSTVPFADCREARLADGDLLVTYTDDQVDKPDEMRAVAVVFSERRGLRIVVGSTVAPGVTNPLDLEQLTAIAIDPAWDVTVSAEYADRGDALDTYTSIDDSPAP